MAALAAVGLMATAACSGGTADDQAANKQDKGPTHEVTDVIGHTVQIPDKVDRVLLGGQRQLYTTALLNKDNPLDKIVAWLDDLQANDPDTYKKYSEKFPDLKEITTTGEVYDGSTSPEQALDQDPDVFIISQSSYKAAEEPGLIGDLEKGGVPIVAIDYFTDPVKNTVPSVRLMGDIFGHKADAFADYYQSKVDIVTDRLKKANAVPTPTFIWRAPGYFECCSTFAKSNLAQIVQAVGGKNLGDDMIDAKQGQVSPEAVAGVDPEVIMATGADWDPDKSPVENGTNIPLGYNIEPQDAAKALQGVVDKQSVIKELDAVKNKRIYGAWHHFYDSPYNFLAIEWFAKALHLELFEDVDPQADFKELHEKFLPVSPTGTFWTGLE